MTKFTANELKVLKAIDDSEYGDTLVDGCWSFSVADNSDLKPRSIGGIVSSLVKKGILVAGDSGTEDAFVAFTRAGAETYSRLMAEQGTPCRKAIE